MSSLLAATENVPAPETLKRALTEDNSEEVPVLKKALTETLAEENKRIKRRKYALLISYSGQGYFGLQRNPGTKTIEDDLLGALHQVGFITEEGLKQPQSFQFQRAARTDKGVSAVRQVLSARLPEGFEVEEVNKILPDQIRVMGFKRATKGFNCKMNCDARTYSYTMPSFALAPSSLGRKIPSNYKSCDSSNPDSCTLVRSDATETSPKDASDSSRQSDDSEPAQEPEVDFDLEELSRFRASPELVKRTNEVLQHYLGTHNYYNFTSRRKAMDPSCQRYIISFSCSDPVMYDNVEFVTLKVKGQSFMLHQIRKMVGLAIAIMRGLTGVETIAKAWSQHRLDLPIAPGLGLVLEEVHYDRYNKRYGTDGMHEPIEWAAFSKELEEFKTKFIMSTILKTEKTEQSMSSWLKGLEHHTFEIRESGPPEIKEDTSQDHGYRSD